MFILSVQNDRLLVPCFFNMQTTLVNQAGIERLPIIWHQTVRDDYLGEGLGSGVLIGHQGANNTRLSTCSMRQSPYLIE